ncbi:Hint domain-containing protein [Acetobacter malorum]|uniref:Hint domain-containing protein n=1 Tax=Acetobacter malorum TaxID=178901 RepID=UPI0039EC15DE
MSDTSETSVDFQTIENNASAAGGNSDQYQSGETNYHQHDMSWRWVGGTSGDWSDPANWTLSSSTNNAVDTSNMGGAAIPQLQQNADVNIGPGDATSPITVVANAAIYNQFRSLSVWQDSTLKITAQGSKGTKGNVFAVAGFENNGTIIVDTPSRVEFGGVTENRDSGVFTIMNNHGNVIFDDSNLNGSGTINLINASLGSAGEPVSIGGNTLNLQQNSSVFLNSGVSVTLNVDPATVNTIYVQDNFLFHTGAGGTNDQNAVINGVSQNTHFGIADLGTAPTSAAYTANSDGSYTLQITMADGSDLTYKNLHMADGYTPPATLSIVQDSSGSGWDVEDTSSPAATGGYTDNDLHQQMAAVSTSSTDAGGDTSQYSSSDTSFHHHDMSWVWTGGASSDDWNASKNWELLDSSGNVVDTSTWNDNPIPQSEQNADVNIGYSGSDATTTPVTVVANAPDYNQIRSLSVWQNGTLKITAQGNSSYVGNVFATAGFENNGNIIIDTPSDVELGGVAMNRESGTITIMNNQGNVTLDNGTLNNGGTLNLINASLGTVGKPVWVQGGTVNLMKNSTVFAQPGISYDSPTTINVEPSSINTVYIDDNGDKTTAQNVVVNGVSADTRFGIADLSAAPVSATYTPNADNASYTLTIGLANGEKVTYGTIVPADGYTPASTQIVQDAANNGWLIENADTETCFLPGSMIRTASGEVPVENIVLGTELVAFDWKNGREVIRPVVWVGKAHSRVRTELPHDEAGYPVRVLKNAIADGVPYKDMLITPEHCLFFDGQFVPVRMLVNGKSIFYDTSITAYDYYHVETAEHSVITADGMLTESYLDTGNRSTFRQDGKVAALRATGARSWEADAAAPLCVARNFVESLFRTLEARESNVENCQTPEASVTMTNNPDLHLVMTNGAVIRPVRRDGQNYSFMIPAGVDAVRIASRASRPSDVIGPFVDDRRYLGVAVSSIRFMSSKTQNQITTYLDDAGLDGWHETNGQSDSVWTNGSALLPLSEQTEGKMGMLIITALPAENYSVDAEQTAAVKKLTA